jgi:uncharacterized protein YkwD
MQSFSSALKVFRAIATEITSPAPNFPIPAGPGQTATRLEHMQTLQLALLLILITTQANPQSSAEQTLLRLTNQTFAQYHLAPLALDPTLALATRLHASLSAGGDVVVLHNESFDVYVDGGELGGKA